MHTARKSLAAVTVALGFTTTAAAGISLMLLGDSFFSLVLAPVGIALIITGLAVLRTQPYSLVLPPPDACPHCRYDRSGLPPGSPCPECGKPIITSIRPDSR